MNIWFAIYFGLSFLAIGVNLAKDGQPRKENYSFFVALTSLCLKWTILYMAGAFDGLIQ